MMIWVNQLKWYLNNGHKLRFENWFKIPQLIQYLEKTRNLVVGIIGSNHLLCYPLVADKDWQKQHKGLYDDQVDYNGGVTIVKWNRNNFVSLISSFATDSKYST